MKTSIVVVGICGLLTALYLIADRARPASGFQRGEEAKQPKFPSLRASNLEGKVYSLPNDFEGKVNLCLFAFTQEQQYDVNTWLDALKEMEGSNGFEVYEFPTIAKTNPMFRYWLDSVMVQGIPNKRQRERTITLYLAIPSPKIFDRT